MSKNIVISFENDSISVVYGVARGGNLIVQNTLTFPKEELDGFLQKEKAKEFTVVCDFKAFFSGVVSLPLVDDKFFMKVLHAEIKKTFLGLKEYSFIYTVLGEGFFEGEKKQEVFVFAVNNDDIYGITDKFYKHGKRITRLIPNILSLSYTVLDSKEPILCLTKSGRNKYLFLLKDGKMFFIRNTRGIDNGLHDFDVENINTAISYCRQSLRIYPAQVILIGSACFEYDAKVDPVVPLVCLDYRPKVLASKETIIKFMPAIACLCAEKQSKSFFQKSDILPVKYKLGYNLKTALMCAMALFIILFVAGSGYTALSIGEMLDTKKKNETVRTKIKNIESVRSEYQNKMKELQKLMPLIKFVNRVNSEDGYQKLLLIMANLTIENIRIDSIFVTPAPGALSLTMKGVVEAEGFNQTRFYYQNFVNSMEKTEGMNVSFHRVEAQDKTFTIEATYKPE